MDIFKRWDFFDPYSSHAVADKGANQNKLIETMLSVQKRLYRREVDLFQAEKELKAFVLQECHLRRKTPKGLISELLKDDYRSLMQPQSCWAGRALSGLAPKKNSRKKLGAERTLPKDFADGFCEDLRKNFEYMNRKSLSNRAMILREEAISVWRSNGVDDALVLISKALARGRQDYDEKTSIELIEIIETHLEIYSDFAPDANDVAELESILRSTAKLIGLWEKAQLNLLDDAVKCKVEQLLFQVYSEGLSQRLVANFLYVYSRQGSESLLSPRALESANKIWLNYIKQCGETCKVDNKTYEESCRIHDKLREISSRGCKLYEWPSLPRCETAGLLLKDKFEKGVARPFKFGADPALDLYVQRLSAIKSHGLSAANRDKSCALLVFGRPGSEKAEVLKSIAQYLDAKVVKVRGTDIKQKYYGESEKKLKALMLDAKAWAVDEKQVMLFVEFDNLESLAASRDASDSMDDKGGQGANRNILTLLLAILEPSFLRYRFDEGGRAKEGTLVIVGTTDVLKDIDAAILSRIATRVMMPQQTPGENLRSLVEVVDFVSRDKNLDSPEVFGYKVDKTSSERNLVDLDFTIFRQIRCLVALLLSRANMRQINNLGVSLNQQIPAESNNRVMYTHMLYSYFADNKKWSSVKNIVIPNSMRRREVAVRGEDKETSSTARFISFSLDLSELVCAQSDDLDLDEHPYISLEEVEGYGTLMFVVNTQGLGVKWFDADKGDEFGKPLRLVANTKLDTGNSANSDGLLNMAPSSLFCDYYYSRDEDLGYETRAENNSSCVSVGQLFLQDATKRRADYVSFSFVEWESLVSGAKSFDDFCARQEKFEGGKLKLVQRIWLLGLDG